MFSRDNLQTCIDDNTCRYWTNEQIVSLARQCLALANVADAARKFYDAYCEARSHGYPPLDFNNYMCESLEALDALAAKEGGG